MASKRRAPRSNSPIASGPRSPSRRGDRHIRWSDPRWGSLLLILACAACGGGESGRASAEERLEVAPTPERSAAPQLESEPEPEAEPITCDDPLPLYQDGSVAGTACPDELARRGLTVLDLSDRWVPAIFASASEDDPHFYADIYRALADERLDDVPDEYEKERFLELFGIFPTFRVLLARLEDEARHSCHDAVDDEALGELSATLRPWIPTREDQRARVRLVRYLRHYLGRVVEREELDGIESLATHEEEAARYRRLLREAIPVDAIRATQAHLRCDGLITERTRFEEGVFDGRTSAPLARFQRMHMIVSAGLLDEETRRGLAEDSRQADHAAALRSLRERVVAATGLIEDGSAGHAWEDVLGVRLDAPQFRFDARSDPAESPAPALVARATEAAARALGFLDPASTASALRAIREAGHGRVVVQLPPLPDYHADHMELVAVLDRGRVDYRYPYDSQGRRIWRRAGQRPTLTLYVDTPEGRRALVRWPTTIGGWKPERNRSGGVGLRFKNSPPGERVWRDVVAAPAWLPPPSTPDDELIRRLPGGRIAPKLDLLGPGYRSAYGLAMLMHHRVLPPVDPDGEGEEAEPRFFDEGIRVHGSVSYRSITGGTSHGCHRLYNHLAVRLSSFVLRHRRHVRHGEILVRYGRRLRAGGQEVRLRMSSRGYRYELTPPVPVEVLAGDVVGDRSPPTGFFLLPEQLAARALAEDAE